VTSPGESHKVVASVTRMWYAQALLESRAYEFCTTPLTDLNSPPMCSLSPSACSSHTRL
jgi:hypothetical protein